MRVKVKTKPGMQKAVKKISESLREMHYGRERASRLKSTIMKACRASIKVKP